MIKKGETSIAEVYKGSETITEIYKGEDLVYQAIGFVWNGNAEANDGTGATATNDGSYHGASCGGKTYFSSFNKQTGVVVLGSQSSAGGDPNITGHMGPPSVSPAIPNISIVNTNSHDSSGRTWKDYSVTFNVNDMTKGTTYRISSGASTDAFSSRYWSVRATSASCSSTFYRK